MTANIVQVKTLTHKQKPKTEKVHNNATQLAVYAKLAENVSFHTFNAWMMRQYNHCSTQVDAQKQGNTGHVSQKCV